MYGGIIMKGILEVLNKAVGNAEELRKAITVSTGFNIQNYEQGYKNLIPITPTYFRDRVFSRPDASGNGMAWKLLKSMDANRTLGYVPEGKRAAELAIESEEGSIGWKTWGVEDGYSQESEQQNASLIGSAGTEDLCIANLAQCFAQKEERILWSANNDQALGKSATPSGSYADLGTGESSTITAHKYYGAVVALTHDGAMLASAGNGLVPIKAVTSPAGESYNINGGCGIASDTSAGVSCEASHMLTFQIDKRSKDVYYAWYVGIGTGSGNEDTPPATSAMYLQAITSVPIFKMHAPLITSTQTLAAFNTASGAADCSCVSIAPNGIFSQLLKTSKWVHFDHLSASEGVLTIDDGQVACIKEAFRQMWSRLRIGPEAFLVSANTYNTLNSLAMSDTATKTSFVFEAIQTVSGVMVSARLKGVVNPYTGEVVPFEVYPNIPDGWIVGTRMTAFIPGQPSNRTVEVQSFGGVWRVDWQPMTRSNYHGMYRSGGVKLYMPSAFIVITGVVTDTFAEDVSGNVGSGYQM